MKKIIQRCYYNDGNPHNSKVDNVLLTKNDFVNGNAFKNYYPILQLGIQAIPGTKFYVNGNTYPVMIGITGVYELDLQGEVEIESLIFDLPSMNNIEDTEGAYLIVDIIYDDTSSEEDE